MAGKPAEAATAYCRTCGWLVPVDGVSIQDGYDVPREGARPGRCDDTACESAAECDEYGEVKRPRGRPRLYEGQRLAAYRLDAETLAGIERLAKELGVSRAEVIRRAVREMAARRDT